MKTPLKDRHGKELSIEEATPKIKNRFFNYYLDLKVAFLWLLWYNTRQRIGG